MHKEIRGLHQAAYILALFTFGSQLLALLRDRLLAHQFGADIELDLYYTAFRIPDALYVVFASTLSIYVLIPFLSKRIEQDSSEAAQKFLSQFFTLFIILYSGVACLAFVYTDTIVRYVFPGFVDQSALLVPLIRILLIQPLLLGVSSLFGVITQLEHRFMLYAVSPIIYNVGIIFGLIFLYPKIGIYGLVWGVVLGALGHVCVQIPSVYTSKLAPRFVWAFSFTDIIAVCKTSFTRALTLSLHQFVLLGFVSFASIMTVGSVSVFQLAYNLQSVPLAIIGVSYSVAAFPLLAQLYAEKKFDLLGSNITTAIRHILFWSMPTIALFVVVRAQFVRAVLGSGEFNWDDTRLTAAILALFIISLAPQAINLLIVRALYAVENTLLPFVVTFFSSVCALFGAYAFYVLIILNSDFHSLISGVMRLEGVQGIEVLALPLGYSCALILHSIVLFFFSNKYLHTDTLSIAKTFIQSSVAALVAGWIAYSILNSFVLHVEVDTFIAVLVQGGLASVFGLIVYGGILFAFKNSEINEIFTTLKKRFSREDVVVAQDEDTLSI